MDIETLGNVSLIVLGVLIALVLILALGILLIKYFNAMVKAEYKLRQAQDKLVEKYGCMYVMCESIPTASIPPPPPGKPWAYPGLLKKLLKCPALRAIFVCKCIAPVPTMMVKYPVPLSIRSIYKIIRCHF